MLDSSPQVIEAIEIFIQKALPTGRELLIFTPLAAIITWPAASLAAWLNIQKQWKTPYTRKVFHFLIFSTASLLQLVHGLPAVIILGIVTSLFVLAAVYRGEDSRLYKALARPSDTPQQKLFILVPLFTTALGGVLSNLFFGPFASIGYLVGGWGDAVGEPVGTRWGQHRYRVLSLAGVKASRSLEGSAAVLAVGSLVAFLGLLALGAAPSDAIKIGLTCGLGGMLVEAFSSHGLDNLTIQVAASGIAFALWG
jgi:phytol kinase